MNIFTAKSIIIADKTKRYASTMVNKRTIKYLYKNIRRPKNGLSRRLLTEVEDCCRECFNITFDNEQMTIGALEESNPFRNIRLSSINGFKIVGSEVAVVMEYSILFFNNATGAIDVNIREPEETFFQRLINGIKYRIAHLTAKPCFE